MCRWYTYTFLCIYIYIYGLMFACIVCENILMLKYVCVCVYLFVCFCVCVCVCVCVFVCLCVCLFVCLFACLLSNRFYCRAVSTTLYFGETVLCFCNVSLNNWLKTYKFYRDSLFYSTITELYSNVSSTSITLSVSCLLLMNIFYRSL